MVVMQVTVINLRAQGLRTPSVPLFAVQLLPWRQGPALELSLRAMGVTHPGNNEEITGWMQVFSF